MTVSKQLASDLRIIYVKTGYSWLPGFDLMEKDLKEAGFNFVSGLGSVPALEAKQKLETNYLCISLEKKTFVRMPDYKKEYYTPISWDEFKKKYAGAIHGHKFGL